MYVTYIRNTGLPRTYVIFVRNSKPETLKDRFYFAGFNDTMVSIEGENLRPVT